MAVTLARTLRAPRIRLRPVLRVRSPADRSAGHRLRPAASQAPAGHRRWSFHIRVPGRFAWHELLRTKTERGGSRFPGSRPGAATGGFLSAAAGLTSTFRLGLRLERALSRANHFTIPIVTGSDRATRCGIPSGKLRPGTALSDGLAKVGCVTGFRLPRRLFAEGASTGASRAANIPELELD